MIKQNDSMHLYQARVMDNAGILDSQIQSMIPVYRELEATECKPDVAHNTSTFFTFERMERRIASM